MIKFKHKGSFKFTERFFKNSMFQNHQHIFENYGRRGVAALASATPKDSGDTASSWDYTITNNRKRMIITWTNSNIVGTVPLAILIQYGHGTGSGGYVQGRDFINPAMRPIFDQLANDLWREVTK